MLQLLCSINSLFNYFSLLFPLCLLPFSLSSYSTQKHPFARTLRPFLLLTLFPLWPCMKHSINRNVFVISTVFSHFLISDFLFPFYQGSQEHSDLLQERSLSYLLQFSIVQSKTQLKHKVMPIQIGGQRSVVYDLVDLALLYELINLVSVRCRKGIVIRRGRQRMKSAFLHGALGSITSSAYLYT